MWAVVGAGARQLPTTRSGEGRLPLGGGGTDAAAAAGDLVGPGELGVGDDAHLGQVEAGDLVLLVGADAALRQRALDGEEGEGDAEDHRPDDQHADGLRGELAPAEGALVVEDPG